MTNIHFGANFSHPWIIIIKKLRPYLAKSNKQKHTFSDKIKQTYIKTETYKYAQNKAPSGRKRKIRPDLDSDPEVANSPHLIKKQNQALCWTVRERVHFIDTNLKIPIKWAYVKLFQS